MIEVSGVSKAYKKEVILKDISFSVGKGASACIIGLNGSGKSTLLSIIAGLLTKDSGTVTLGSNDRGTAATIGFVPQDNHLFPELKVKDNIVFWAAASNLSVSSAQVQDYIQLFNISSFWNKKITQLSGGMAKRVALCAALLHNPDILLLDEPFTGLDILHKEEIVTYLSQLRKQKKTILYSSHSSDEIHLMATELFVIHDGQIHPVSIKENLTQINQNVSNYLRGEFLHDKQ